MDSEKLRVYSYNPEDEKVFAYLFEEDEIQTMASVFMNDIFFYMNDEELQIFNDGAPSGTTDNLKIDFVWYSPKVNGLQIVQCTCGQFLESGRNLGKLAKLAVAHSRRTGHALNPRGN